METSIIVQNLKCGGCSNTIASKLSALQNISNLQVDVEQNKVSFHYLNTDDVSKVKDLLESMGYPSIEATNSLTSKAKSFLSCATGKFSK